MANGRSKTAMKNEIKDEAESKAHRTRLLYLDPDYVGRVFSRGLLRNKYINLPEPIGLPLTAWVRSVHYDFCRNSLVMVIEDQSFEEVKPGELSPEIRVLWQTIELPMGGEVEWNS